MLRQLSYMLASLFIRLFTTVFVFVVLARVWGPSSFGRFMYPFTIATLIVMLVDYGFGLQLVRDVGRSPAQVVEIVRRAGATKLLLTVVAITVTAVTQHWVSETPSDQMLLWILSIAAIANSYGLFLNLPFRGVGRFDLEAKTTAVANLVLFICVAAAAATGEGPLMVASIFAGARVLYAAIAARAYLTVIGVHPFRGLHLREGFAGLMSGFPFGVHVVLGTLYFQLDTVLVQHYLGAHAVGVYQAGIRLMMGGMIFADGLSGVYLPRVSSTTTNSQEVVRMGRAATRQLVLLGCAGLTLLALAAAPTTRLFYGAKYAALAPLLPLFGVVLFLRYAAAAHGVILTVTDRQSVRAIAVTLAALANVLLNILLIPTQGLLGAVVAAALTHVLLDAIYVVVAWKDCHDSLFDARAIAGLGIAALIIAGSWASRNSAAMSALLLCVGVFVPAALATSGLQTVWAKLRIAVLKTQSAT